MLAQSIFVFFTTLTVISRDLPTPYSPIAVYNMTARLFFYEESS